MQSVAWTILFGLVLGGFLLALLKVFEGKEEDGSED